MKKPEISIFDHNNGGGLSDFGNHKLGVYFYDEHILFGWEHDFGVRSYLFRLAIVRNEWTSFRRNTPYNYEVIDFIWTGDLKEMTITEELSEQFKKMFERDFDIDLDYKKLISLTCQDQYDLVVDRLNRKAKKVDPVPVPKIQTMEDRDTTETFLQFTEETAGDWCGPHEVDNKKGCLCKLKKLERKELPVFDVRVDYMYWNLPYTCQRQIDEMAKANGYDKGGPNYFYGFSKDQKREFFKSLPLKEQHLIYKKCLKEMIDPEHVEWHLPYCIYLCGTDDLSYSKQFSTQEEMEEEFQYLNKMQPLHFRRDIVDRKYFFTN
jgi:hypothetical protein